MRVRVSVVCLVLLFSAFAHSEEPAAPADQFISRIDYDPDFLTQLTVSWLHPFSSTMGLSGTFEVFANLSTMALYLNWYQAFGDFTIAPGIGTTFGIASWGYSIDKRQFLGREIVPLLYGKYRTTLFEIESLSNAFIPVQESQATAVWLTSTRLWGVVKWQEFGIGPHIEPVFSKEDSASSLKFVELWVGGHFLKNWPKATFELFLGYDPISVDKYLGVPKKAGMVFRGTFYYLF